MNFARKKFQSFELAINEFEMSQNYNLLKTEELKFYKLKTQEKLVSKNIFTYESKKASSSKKSS